MKRVLIGYATRAGSTRDVAGILADEFRTLDCDVDVVDLARSKPSASGYDLVVVGSGINAGLWFSEATSWARTQAPDLSSVPVAVFNVCMYVAEPDRREETLAYNTQVAKMLDPVASESFAGRYDPGKVNWFKRLLMRSMGKSPQDHVDPPTIQAWARQVMAVSRTS